MFAGFRVTLLTSRILMRLLDFCKLCARALSVYIVPEVGDWTSFSSGYHSWFLFGNSDIQISVRRRLSSLNFLIIAFSRSRQMLGYFLNFATTIASFGERR